jgi:hypothetical protein
MSTAPGGYVSAWKDDEVLALGEVADKFVAAELTGKRDRCADWSGTADAHPASCLRRPHESQTDRKVNTILVS